jgi:hypothetical protein
MAAKTADRITDEKEKRLSPQRVGRYPPMAEPKNIPIQINSFEFTLKFFMTKNESI